MKNQIANLFVNLSTTNRAIVLACQKNRGTAKAPNGTNVATSDRAISVVLWGTEVVRLTSQGELTIYMNGYATPTTRQRINGTLNALGLGEYQVSQKGGIQYIQGKAFDSSKHQVFNLLAVEAVAA